MDKDSIEISRTIHLALKHQNDVLNLKNILNFFFEILKMNRIQRFLSEGFLKLKSRIRIFIEKIK